MTDSQSSLVAIILGLAVFSIIVAIGWRSVQNRRILRLQGANGQETIIVASEDDDISSVVTTSTAETAHPAPAPASPMVVVNTGVAADPAPQFGRAPARSEAELAADADDAARSRLDRVASSAQ
ncbi:MAG TPA: hypothetical protein VEZ70_01265 [Allosphingosinicella sp.]|nr:hypothetical protein [Allosphingosinicella sp.]